MRQGFLDFLSEKMNSHVSWLSTEGNGGRDQCCQIREQQWDSQSDTTTPWGKLTAWVMDYGSTNSSHHKQAYILPSHHSCPCSSHALLFCISSAGAARSPGTWDPWPFLQEISFKMDTFCLGPGLMSNDKMRRKTSDDQLKRFHQK